VGGGGGVNAGGFIPSVDVVDVWSVRVTFVDLISRVIIKFVSFVDLSGVHGHIMIVS